MCKGKLMNINLMRLWLECKTHTQALQGVLHGCVQNAMTRWTDRECDDHADAVKLQGELPSTLQEMHTAFKAAIDHARFHFITNEWNEFEVRDPNGVVHKVNVRRANDAGVVELHVTGLSQPVREQVTNGMFQLNLMAYKHLTFQLTNLILACNISQ
jgi:hypothetical protein